MTGFLTVPDAIRTASTATSDAVKALREADCGTPVGNLADALPGSNAAVAASGYARSWKTAFDQWCDLADQHAVTLSRVADNYANVDEINATDLDPYVGGNYNIQSVDSASGRLAGPH